jgi:hypothetical protein
MTGFLSGAFLYRSDRFGRAVPAQKFELLFFKRVSRLKEPFKFFYSAFR